MKIPHLLVIDTDTEFLSRMDSSMKDFACEVSCASSIQDGISLLARRREISVALVGVPNVIQAGEALFDLYPKLDIIGVYPGEAEIPLGAREEAKKMGFRAIVSKPLNLLYLALLLEAVTSRPRPIED